MTDQQDSEPLLSGIQARDQVLQRANSCKALPLINYRTRTLVVVAAFLTWRRAKKHLRKDKVCTESQECSPTWTGDEMTLNWTSFSTFDSFRSVLSFSEHSRVNSVNFREILGQNSTLGLCLGLILVQSGGLWKRANMKELESFTFFAKQQREKCMVLIFGWFNEPFTRCINPFLGKNHKKIEFMKVKNRI